MSTSIIALNQRFNQEKGLKVTEEYTAMSGFKYITGEKDCEAFKIVEAVAEGVGIAYFCGFKVYIEDELIVSQSYRDKAYTRDTVRQLVGRELNGYFVEMLQRQNKELSVSDIEAKVNEILDKAYYEKSDQASMNLLKKWGIVS